MTIRHAARALCAILGTALTVSGAWAAASGGALTVRLEPAPERDAADRIVPPSVERLADPPRIEAYSGVLMDPVSGQVLYAKNPHERLPMASTTKIMTAILLIENCKMTDEITASKNACQTPYTSLHLKPGERISAKDLLIGLMVRSANDAAVAAAEHISGTVPKFAALMNSKAAEIGCKNTRFVNPNGLYDKNHYSSAYDLCLMAKYAMQYPEFNEAVNTRRHTLSSRTLNKEDLVVVSRHYFMKNYPYADGIKSGYVKEARYCYVGSATRGDWRLIAAVLKSEHSGKDTIALLDYGFANFQPVMVARRGDACAEVEVSGGASRTAPVAPARDLRVVVPRTGARITTRLDAGQTEAPIEKGAEIGVVRVLVNGVEAASAPACAVEAVQMSFVRRARPWAMACGIALVCAAVGGRYGAALTKDSRRRRRGVASALRGTDRFR